MESYQVIWAPQALKDLKAIYDYIDAFSSKGADTVFDALLDLGDSLTQMPERFPLEPILKDRPEAFRFAAKWTYKLIYCVREESKEVIIARVFSTKQNPGKLLV